MKIFVKRAQKEFGLPIKKVRSDNGTKFKNTIVDECFLQGYGSNEHAYRVFNKTSGRVEIAVDVIFDEFNGSQVEQVDSSVVGKEDPPCEAIKQLAIGDIRPQEEEVTEVEVPQVVVAPISADVPDATLQQPSAATLERGSAALEGSSAAPT